MTNSPQMRQAETWTQDQYRAWGLKDVHLEGFEFGRGWSIERSSVRMVTPRVKVLRSIPIAWTPPTEAHCGPCRTGADAARAGLHEVEGDVARQIVLVSKPEQSTEPDEPAFKRLTDDDLDELSEYQQPRHSEAEIARTLKEAHLTTYSMPTWPMRVRSPGFACLTAMRGWSRVRAMDIASA